MIWMAEDMEFKNGVDDSVTPTAPSAYHTLGYADADGMERKAMVVRALESRIEKLGLTRSDAAERLGLEEIELDRILRGVFRRHEESSLAALEERLG